jgi:hypothetical protein
MTSVFSTIKTDRHDITEILLTVSLNTIPPPAFFLIAHFAHIKLMFLPFRPGEINWAIMYLY